MLSCNLQFQMSVLLTNSATVVYSESCQISKVELFARIVNGFQALIIFAKSATLDICRGSEYFSAVFRS